MTIASIAMPRLRGPAYILLVTIAALLCSGCSTGEYLIRVSAVGAPPPPSGMRYFLLQQDTTVKSRGPEFHEVTGYLKKVLAELHYTEAESLGSADVAILLTYSLRRPPGYRNSLTLRDEEDEIGGMIPFRISMWASGTSYGESRSGIPLPWKTTKKVFERAITLEAFEGAAFREGKTAPVWKVRATSIGHSTDLGKVIPVMLDACKPFIGTTTPKEVEVRGRQ